MKRMLDMTSEELMALDGDARDALIDLECAEEGVRLLPPHPGERPEPALGKPDVECFDVKGILFDNEEIARCVVDFINSKRMVETHYHRGEISYGNPEGVRVTDDPISMKRKWYWSTVHYEEHRVQLEEAKAKLSKFEELETAYNSAARARDKVVDELDELVGTAWAEKHEVDGITSDFERYVKIANGDKNVAFDFFMNATKHEEDLVRRVLDIPLQIQAEMPEEADYVGEEDSEK